MAFRANVSDKKWRSLIEMMNSLNILEVDLEESFVRAGGKGGQKVNRSNVKVVLLHTVSNIRVSSAKTRSQDLNRYYARRLLCEALAKKNGVYLADFKNDIKQKRKRKKRSREKYQSNSD